MLDYLKIRVENPNLYDIMNHKDLEFKTVVSVKTHLPSTKYVSEYHFCKVTVFDSGLVFFSGSIHKMWNSLQKIEAPNRPKVVVKKLKDGSIEKYDSYKGFNGNQYTISQIQESIKHLENLFSLNANQFIIQNIELGINADVNFNPQSFIKGLLYHSGKPFEYRYQEHFAQALHQRYVLKIYNKSNQYKMKTPTLRVELKMITVDQTRPLGIKTLADINTTTLDRAFKLLLKKLDEVVYYDNTIKKESLSKSQHNRLDRYSNPRYWMDNLTKQNRLHHKNKLNKITALRSLNLKKQITHSIKEKFMGIIGKNTLPITSVFDPKKEVDFSSILRRFEKTNTLPITSSSIAVIGTINPLQISTTKPI